MMRNGYTTRAAVSSWDKSMTHDESFYYGNEPSIFIFAHCNQIT